MYLFLTVCSGLCLFLSFSVLWETYRGAEWGKTKTPSTHTHIPYLLFLSPCFLVSASISVAFSLYVCRCFFSYLSVYLPNYFPILSHCTSSLSLSCACSSLYQSSTFSSPFSFISSFFNCSFSSFHFPSPFLFLPPPPFALRIRLLLALLCVLCSLSLWLFILLLFFLFLFICLLLIVRFLPPPHSVSSPALPLPPTASRPP